MLSLVTSESSSVAWDMKKDSSSPSSPCCTSSTPSCIFDLLGCSWRESSYLLVRAINRIYKIKMAVRGWGYGIKLVTVPQCSNDFKYSWRSVRIGRKTVLEKYCNMPHEATTILSCRSYLFSELRESSS